MSFIEQITSEEYSWVLGLINSLLINSDHGAHVWGDSEDDCLEVMVGEGTDAITFQFWVNDDGTREVVAHREDWDIVSVVMEKFYNVLIYRKWGTGLWTIWHNGKSYEFS